jgi:phosphoglucomutase
MDINKRYDEWCQKVTDEGLLAELKAVADKEDLKNDMFYRDLEFGTGGLRGVLGAGTNRMNIYNVRRATQGMADFVKETDKSGSPAVAISYDSRNNSDVFAKAAAEVLTANGIKSYIYTELAPTPMLSFAVRELNCNAGIMVTASHNPAKYNGYKAYGADGCQLSLEDSENVIEKVNATDIWDVKFTPFEEGVKSGMVEYISQDLWDKYYENVLAQSINTDILKQAGLRVVYTPLNGAGNKPVRTILSKVGVTDIHVVKEQENPDGNFPTCPYPNPEFEEALQLGLKLSKEVKPDLLLATDPDSDRVGIAVPDGDGYTRLTGNEVGAMLLDYICSQRTEKGTMPENPVAVKTIVTTDIIYAITKKYNLEVFETLTGFKFIGEQITRLEEKGEENRYVFGFEESYGYLAGTYVRDKDAVVGSMMICEMAAYYKSQGLTMIQARDKMYETYGVYRNCQASFQFEGETGMRQMQALMNKFRTEKITELGGFKVIAFADYIASKTVDFATNTEKTINLPKSDVITFYLENNASVIIRPSGTEPKIKAYYTATGKTMDDAIKAETEISTAFEKHING